MIVLTPRLVKKIVITEPAKRPVAAIRLEEVRRWLTQRDPEPIEVTHTRDWLKETR